MNIKAKYSRQDFNDADRIGRIYIALVQPDDFTLTPRDRQYADLVRQVYLLQRDAKPQSHIIKLLENTDRGVWKSQMFNLISDARTLFGATETLDREMIAVAVADKMKLKFEQLENIIEETDDANTKISAIEIQRRLLEALMRMVRHDPKKSGKNAFSNEPPLMPPQIDFTTDYEEENVDEA